MGDLIPSMQDDNDTPPERHLTSSSLELKSLAASHQLSSSGLFASLSQLPSRVSMPGRRLNDLLSEVQAEFEKFLIIEDLLVISQKLQRQLKESLTWGESQCMLPSHQYALPAAEEREEWGHGDGGACLALEVGGSFLKVGLVEMTSRGGGGGVVPHRRLGVAWARSWLIEDGMKRSQENGVMFFDWIANKIQIMLDSGRDQTEFTKPMRMGIAWSFPIESV